ncbi:Acetylcholinesterase-1 [Araneus ventricosus]|uniref:Acetylcholinesterase-1 n=1 Tax=Araneus ventricosus TaxID=182803 RepID=A0A4Y2IH14_ARAVE|nr:Acetylcholinesterase-1 [Araneus ventricosus]
MDWPVYSPDFNSIEHVWDMLGRRIAARQPPPTCLPELRRALLDEWCNIPQDQIDNLILSMPRRSLWDILEGLKWVNQNIAYFGGDPTRITFAGESTGSNTVGLFSASPLTKGLFIRQIMQSGAPFLLGLGNMTVNLMFSQQIAKIVGCADDDNTIENNPKFVVECLKGVDSVSLSKADFRINPRRSIALVPRFGDEFLPEDPKEVIFHQKFPCTELLIGNNRDEGSFQITTFNPELFGFFGEKNTFFTKEQGQDRIRRIFQNFTDPEAVVNHYLPANFPEDDYPGIRYQVYTSLGDKVFVCPDVYHAEKCAENGGKVYFYWWAHRSSNSPWAPWMGAAHFSELEFIFGQPLLNPSDFEPEELEISEQMIEIWSSFVKEGCV